ncbi:chaperone modulator CbpM [Variovorax sp.]|uniref:chaperone modulator CbpM n=1 Tax=Variovorax sp. TaxID=1871043 RepID=UPI002D745A52|nr:chaperone modulator CbpM [Variovorax sp.]HYP83609.1 chaperone modulator CbpM [Variovorax sp.]
MVTIKHSFSATVLDDTGALATTELAHACGAGEDWVVQLVEVGLVEAEGHEGPPQQWRFHSSALQCALEARRLQRDFDVGLDAAALIIELQSEVRRLKSMLNAQGLRLR